MNRRSRLSCPLTTRRLWTAINAINFQQQVPYLRLIVQYMNRQHGMDENETICQLNLCILDQLICLVRSYGGKGLKKGHVKKSFAITQEQKKDDHDWYCFECHLAIDLLYCSSCHRSYHLRCVKIPPSDKRFVCRFCKSVEDSHIDPKRLNKLLSYVVKLLNDNSPSSLFSWKSENIPENLLIYKPMNLTLIAKNISNRFYKHVMQFKADVQNIVHNVFIFFGVESDLYKKARRMFEVCEGAIKEIQLCADCFEISYEKEDKFWFCKPCQSPHKLVYAQVRGFPYWPAKVMEETDTHIDVRFFGGHHQRALVDKKYIKSITVNIDEVQKKQKSSSWERAYNELKLYQINLKNSSIPEVKTENLKEINVEDKDLSLNDSSQVVGCKGGLCSLAEGSSHTNQDCTTGNAFECSNKEIHSSESQTYCSNHKHHFFISKKKKDKTSSSSPSKLDKNKRGVSDLSSEVTIQVQSGNQHDNKIINHQENNLNCPLNCYKITCESNCEVEKEKQQRIKTAMSRINKKYDDLVRQIAQKHIKVVEHTKRKRWCVVCHKEAKIHCCWNTEYCSKRCQDQHWLKEHSLICACQEPFWNQR